MEVEVKKIWFDMDGTIADLYGVEDWLSYLRKEDTHPYDIAKPMLNFSLFARFIHKLQNLGWEFGIVSWTSKVGSEFFNEQIAISKIKWLNKHLPSVEWDYIEIIPYGVNKFELCGGGVFFDDEIGNREAWGENAFEPQLIIEKMKELIG